MIHLHCVIKLVYIIQYTVIHTLTVQTFWQLVSAGCKPFGCPIAKHFYMFHDINMKPTAYVVHFCLLHDLKTNLISVNSSLHAAVQLMQGTV
jgi:hypothetical protein